MGHLHWRLHQDMLVCKICAVTEGQKSLGPRLPGNRCRLCSRAGHRSRFVPSGRPVVCPRIQTSVISGSSVVCLGRFLRRLWQSGSLPGGTDLLRHLGQLGSLPGDTALQRHLGQLGSLSGGTTALQRLLGQLGSPPGSTTDQTCVRLR